MHLAAQVQWPQGAATGSIQAIRKVRLTVSQAPITREEAPQPASIFYASLPLSVSFLPLAVHRALRFPIRWEEQEPIILRRGVHVHPRRNILT